MSDDLFGGRKLVARQSEGRFHDEGVGLAPFRRLSRFPRAQFEIAGVKQRFVFGGKKKLRGTKNVTGGQECYIEIVHCSLLAKRQHVLCARAGQTRPHQARGAFRDNDFVVRRNVVAVRVRNESETLPVPGVEPQIVRGQINAPLITNFDHNKNLGAD